MKYATQVAPNSHSFKPLQQRLAKSPHRIRTHIVMDHNENEGTIESGPSTSWVLPISFQSPEGGSTDGDFLSRGYVIRTSVPKCHFDRQG